MVGSTRAIQRTVSKANLEIGTRPRHSIGTDVSGVRVGRQLTGRGPVVWNGGVPVPASEETRNMRRESKGGRKRVCAWRPAERIVDVPGFRPLVDLSDES